MSKEFAQIVWDAATEAECRRLVEWAVAEDLNRQPDWTTAALVPEAATGRAAIVARQAGVLAGLPAARLAIAAIDPRIRLDEALGEGSPLAPGASLGVLAGPARSLLTVERLLLNLVGRLSGIATLTRRHVDAVAGTKARIYDTRKTMPGWRRMEKYAVRQGGGHNHRLGLFDAVLIKDNHLAVAQGFTPAEAVRRARVFLAAECPDRAAEMIVEVEIDRLDQLRDALSAGPDIVLLDNMRPDDLRAAVQLRDCMAPQVELEASGGIQLETVGEVARTGVERISVGALTHSAAWFDVGLDWLAD